MLPEGTQPSQAHTHSLWFGALVAGVSAPVAYWLVLVIIELWIAGGSLGEEIMRSFGMMAMIGVPISLFVMFVFAYPWVMLLQKMDKLSAFSVCASAVAIGAAVAVILAKLAFPTNPVDVSILLLGAVTGLFAGIVFCLAAGIRFRRQSP